MSNEQPKSWGTEDIDNKVGLHKGSAWANYFSSLIMDVITGDISEHTSWVMLFADGLVICDDSRDQLEERLKV